MSAFKKNQSGTATETLKMQVEGKNLQWTICIIPITITLSGYDDSYDEHHCTAFVVGDGLRLEM